MLLSRLLAPRAATPENPRFGLTDAAAWDLFLGSSSASSGVPVNRETALTYSPWWRGITLLAGYVGKTPLYVYRRTDGGRTRDPAHPAYDALLHKPSPYQTANHFRATLTGHALSSGNGYAYVCRRGDGSVQPVAEGGGLLILDPLTTFPVRENGRLLYVTEAGGEKRKLAAEDVFHLKGFGFDGLVGYDVVTKAREALGLGLGQHKHRTIYFRNSARPATILKTAAKLDEKTVAQLRESWERMQSGLENAHRTAILHGGLEAQPFGFDAQQSQFVESVPLSIRDVANFIGVPATKIGDATRTSYASLEQENQSFLDDSLDPWFHTWESEARDKLLSEAEKAADSHLVEFDRRTLIRADLTARSNYNRAALAGRPWRVVNEVREEEGLDPLDDPTADELLDPLNMGQGGAQDGPGPPGQKAPPPAAVASTADEIPTVYPVEAE